MIKKTASYLHVLVISIIILSHAIVYLLIKDHGLMIDENWHYSQIVGFIHHNYEFNPGLAMFPGYHFFISTIVQLIGASTTVASIRLISLSLNLASIIIFYLIAKSSDHKSAMIKTIQYSFFPILFPFFALIYTDIFSLTLILLSIYFINKKKHNLAGLILSADILVRQNNIIWMIFLNIYIYIKTYGLILKTHYINEHMKNTTSFILGPIIFDILLIIFHRVSIGEQTLVKTGIVVPNNLFMMLFIFLLIFLPIILSLLKETIDYWSKKIIFFIPLIFVFIPFNYYFRIENPYNFNTFFVHNMLFVYFTTDIYKKLIFFIVVVISILFIRMIKLLKREDYLLYPFIVIFFLLLWFIDIRYYMIPLVLFMLFRKSRNNITEYITTLYFMIMSIVSFYGIYFWKFFI